MSAHFRHQFLWLLRSHPVEHTAYTLAWVALSVAGWYPAVSNWLGGLPHLLMIILLLCALGLAADAGWQKCAADTNIAWRTRPPRWLAVWLAQLAYCGALALPPFACLTVTGFLLEHTAEHWRLLAVDAGFFLAGTMTICALAGMVWETRSSIAAFVLAGLCAGGGALLYLAGKHIRRSGSAGSGLYNFGYFNEALELPVPITLATVTGFLFLWAMLLSQRAGLREAVIAWVWVTIGPLMLWMLVFRWHSSSDPYPANYAWSGPQQQAFVRRQFPPGARFYTDMSLLNLRGGQEIEEVTRLYQPLPPLHMPLEAGAETIGGGTRLRSTAVRPGELNLEVRLHGFYTSTNSMPGAALPGYHNEGIVALYFPAVPMVLIFEPRGELHSASLRHLEGETLLRATMPDAEALRGLRWTPEIMAGAQVYYFDLEKSAR